MTLANMQHRDVGSRPTAVVLCLIIACGAWLRVHHYRGFDHSDEMEYLQAASDLAAGDYRLPSPGDGGHAWLRWTIILPLAGAIVLFGPDDRACAVPFVLASLAGLVLAYALGRDLLRSRSAGLLAAALLAVVNQDVAWATRLYPDALQSLFMALGVWLLLPSGGLAGGTGTADSGRLPPRQARRAILAGISFALALNTNIISAIFVPVPMMVLILAHSRRHAVRLASWMVVGFAAIYLPLTALYAAAADDPFLELTAIGYTDKPTGEAVDMGGFLASYWARGWSRFGSEVRTPAHYEVFRLLMTDEGFLAVARPAGWCLLLWPLWSGLPSPHRRAWGLAALWLLLLYAAYEFGGSFLPLRKVPRYLHMFLLPMILLIVATWGPWLRGRAVVIGLCLAALFSLAHGLAGRVLLGGAAGPSGLDAVMAGDAAVLAYLLIFGLLLAGRRPAAPALAVGLLVFTVFLWCQKLGTGLNAHTQLGRVVQAAVGDGPVYTNCWRTGMYLRSLHLHHLGRDGVVTACRVEDLWRGVEDGRMVVMYARPVSQYGYCALSQEDSEKLLPVLHEKCALLFDNGLYRVFAPRIGTNSGETNDRPASDAERG